MSSRAPQARETFSKRSIFLLAAIGSAIGMGSVWRFPYVVYDNGGGAFLIPFVVALFTAGIPVLLLDYALGHRYRGGAPLTFRRVSKRFEFMGWVQVGICFIISCYYAVIIAWSAAYMCYGIKQSWGSDPSSFFTQSFLQSSPGFSTDFVPAVAIPLALTWIITIGVLALGVQNGVGAASRFFVPLLALLFLILVVRSLFLPGAVSGLDVLFTANWHALSDGSVWLAAYSQIFFSLSIGYGIMVTYSSYLKRHSDLAGSGLVVVFSTSFFQLLAGICVFAALGFLAVEQQTTVSQVATNGIGLAFIAFPSVISQMQGGAVFGVMFFASLVIAGLTSLVSLVEVVAAAFQDKFALRRVPAVLLTGGAMTILSMVFFATTSGLSTLDLVDKFINTGIVMNALVVFVLVAWVYKILPALQNHLNAVSSIHIGAWWRLCISVLTPVALVWMILTELTDIIRHGYGDYPLWFQGVFGWGVLLLALFFGVFFTALPWSRRTTSLTGAMFTPEVMPEYFSASYRTWLEKHPEKRISPANSGDSDGANLAKKTVTSDASTSAEFPHDTELLTEGTELFTRDTDLSSREEKKGL